MDEPIASRERDLVRCLDCGTEYALSPDGDEAELCPECGGIGWVAVAATRDRKERDS